MSKDLLMKIIAGLLAILVTLIGILYADIKEDIGGIGDLETRHDSLRVLHLMDILELEKAMETSNERKKILDSVYSDKINRLEREIEGR